MWIHGNALYSGQQQRSRFFTFRATQARNACFRYLLFVATDASKVTLYPLVTGKLRKSNKKGRNSISQNVYTTLYNNFKQNKRFSSFQEHSMQKALFNIWFRRILQAFKDGGIFLKLSKEKEFQGLLSLYENP